MVVSSIHSCHSKAFGKTTLNRIEADLWTTCMFFLFAPMAYVESCVEHVCLPFICTQVYDFDGTSQLHIDRVLRAHPTNSLIYNYVQLKHMFKGILVISNTIICSQSLERLGDLGASVTPPRLGGSLASASCGVGRGSL